MRYKISVEYNTYFWLLRNICLKTRVFSTFNHTPCTVQSTSKKRQNTKDMITYKNTF